MATAAPPVWLDLGTLTWTVGDVISFSLPDYIDDTSPEGFTTYSENGSTPNDLSEISLSISSAGLITGTIGEIQGGTFRFLFDADNLKGTTVSSLTVTLVTLIPADPVLANPANITDLEEGSTVSFSLADGLTNAEGNEVVYALDITSDDFPLNVVVNPVTGNVTGIVAADQHDGGSPKNYSMVYRVTDLVTGLSDTATQTLTVSDATAATTPTMSAASSGVPGCAAAKPSWLDDIPDFDLDYGDPLSLNILDYLHDSGDDITSVAGSNVPTGLTLVTSGASMGTFTGTCSSADTFTPTFTGTNNTGTSVNSNAPDMIVAGVAVPAPVLDNVSAVDNSNELFLNIVNDTVTANPDTAETYKLGFTVTVNDGSAIDITYASGAGTGQLKFTADSYTFTGNNTIKVSYNQGAGSIIGDVSTLELATATDVTYVVPDPNSGWSKTVDFEGGTVGANAVGDGIGFSSWAQLSVYAGSPDPVYAGARSCKISTAAGNDNTNKFGGAINLPSNVYKGGSTWMRVRTYMPSSFDYTGENAVSRWFTHGLC
jgi:hypothetical protein